MRTEQKPNKLKQILFPVLAVLLAGVAVALVLGQQSTPENPQQAAPGVETPAPDFHETASPVALLSVNFEHPATTEEEYELLYAACVRYMSAYSSAENTVPVVNVTEDTFIDTEEEPSAEPSDDAAYTEYDRAYFEDFLMVRYVSRNGTICVVGARLSGENRAEVEILDQEDFRSEHFTTEAVEEDPVADVEEPKRNWLFWINNEDEVPTEEPEEKLIEELEETGSVSEETFVSCVGQCVLGLLSGTADEEKTYSHFTAEGAASLLRIMQVMEIDAGSTMGIVLAEVGASEPGMETMDRLYLRCEVLQGAKTVYLNLLVKLDHNLMVYDIDTV